MRRGHNPGTAVDAWTRLFVVHRLIRSGEVVDSHWLLCLSGKNGAALTRGNATAGAPVESGNAAARDGKVEAESDAAAARGGGGTETTRSSE